MVRIGRHLGLDVSARSAQPLARDFSSNDTNEATTDNDLQALSA